MLTTLAVAGHGGAGGIGAVGQGQESEQSEHQIFVLFSSPLGDGESLDQQQRTRKQTNSHGRLLGAGRSLHPCRPCHTGYLAQILLQLHEQIEYLILGGRLGPTDRMFRLQRMDARKSPPATPLMLISFTFGYTTSWCGAEQGVETVVVDVDAVGAPRKAGIMSDAD